MLYYLLALLFTLSLFASDETELLQCQEQFPIIGLETTKNIGDLNIALNTQTQFQEPLYFYFEAKELEDLQALKNCIDYSFCGKSTESIVDDPKNYRLHLWKNMSMGEVQTLMKSCPIKDLAKNLVVRKKSQTGTVIDLKKFLPNNLFQTQMAKRASPAIYHQQTAKNAKAAVDLIRSFLKAKNIAAAEKLILATWGIDLHGYKLNYTKEPGGYAVTNHGKKEISYGNDWLDEPCDYIRMIRHEAEHVAQMKMANSCGVHHLKDHKNRERAAHLNDARFLRDICPNTKDGESVRNHCLNRFRSNYMNH